ncbi:MAG: ABC-type transport auxiliary lipoprotein family protein [Steroidobacteraceae bacterium]|nr:membrane integrity-associated transporter subunit PqiC [Pseudomonadota bacterium]MBP6107246.1 membrane integrity-associated transporter subunit PqiC [Steroidobacteraceae bacterium]MBP7014186.1 membrane integrity-associated transporter subunit PqiC [Steroidobacteraceae bacterium]
MMIATARAVMRPVQWLACASSLALLLGGCAGSLLRSEAEAPDTFRLDFAAATAAAAASATLPNSGLAIAVARPRAAAAIDTDRIAVHSAGNRFDYYLDARWAESAPQMLQQNLVSALAATAQFGGGVMTAPARMPTELLLDVELRRFEVVTAGADAANSGASPVVQVQVQASLVDLRSTARVTSFISEAAVPASENRLSAIIAAFDRANAQVVSDIAARVQAAAVALPAK